MGFRKNFGLNLKQSLTERQQFAQREDKKKKKVEVSEVTSNVFNSRGKPGVVVEDYKASLVNKDIPDHSFF